MLPRQHIRVLCVDDNRSVTDMLRLVLDASGYDVDVAENGFAALNRISRDLSRYPVVITDMRMPGMDGYTLIGEARAAGYGGAFVVLAAMLSPDDRQRFTEIRVSKILDKPSRRMEIVDAVREALAGF